MTDYNFPKALQKQLERDIIMGFYPKGQIVSIEALINRYQAPPEEVKKVINSSVRKGLLSRTFRGGQLSSLGKSRATVISVFQHAAKSGLTPRSDVRGVVVISANKSVAKQLKINDGEPVYKQTRTRFINDQVVANQNNYIPIEVCPGLESVDLSHTSFQIILEDQFNAVVAKIEERYAIQSGNEEDSNILGIEQGAEVLIVQRLSLSPSGLPIVWADIHVRIDRYHYVKELWPEAAVVLENKKDSK